MIHSPSTETLTQPILSHVFQWNVNIYIFVINVFIKYDTSIWLSRLLSIIHPWIWGWKSLINVAFQYSDFLAAKMFMRWIVRFGDYFLGRRPEDPWVTPKALILFWLTDSLVLKTLGISKLNWVVGLWYCKTEVRRRSLWFVSIKNLLMVLALRIIGGLLVGLLAAAGEEVI